MLCFVESVSEGENEEEMIVDMPAVCVDPDSDEAPSGDEDEYDLPPSDAEETNEDLQVVALELFCGQC